MRAFWFVIVAVVAMVAAGCSSSTDLPGTQPGGAASSVVPEVAELRATDTPAALPTATGTDMPASLNADGPYVLFEGEGGIWISNPDGSFLTRLSEVGIRIGLGRADLHRALSPRGDALAWIKPGQDGPVLVTMALPGGDEQVLVNLELGVFPEPDTTSDDYLTTAWEHADLAITQADNVAWQPDDGRLLAFVGAIDGPTSDLYVLDTETEEIRRLTDGPSQAIHPIWSPNGDYVIHFGGRILPPLDPFFIYNHPDGAWAVRLDDGKVIPQPKDLLWPGDFVGWQDDDTYLFSSEDERCPGLNFWSTTVADGVETLVFPTCYQGFHAMSPENGGVLFAVLSCVTCPDLTGTYLLLPGRESPLQILPGPALKVEWLPESGVFDADQQVGLVASDGTLLREPPEPWGTRHPALSKDGWVAWEVTEDREGRVVVAPQDGDFRVILESEVDALIWDPLDGTTLLAASTDGLLYAAVAPDFTPRVVGEFGSRVRQAIWVP